MSADNGGWTVFQRRIDGAVNFYRNWAAYKTGFGYLAGNFWLGPDKSHRLTNAIKGAVLRFDLRHMNGLNGYAKYNKFRADGESDKYRLTVGSYFGNASDSFSVHNQMFFSTFDLDDDQAVSNCAEKYGGAWWYKNCFRSGSSLNGAYPKETGSTDFYKTFMAWLNFGNGDEYGKCCFL